MDRIFQQILQMSLYGSIAIVAVLIMRRLFRDLPKRITCLFWLVPGIRLLLPLNFGSAFSVMNIASLTRNNKASTNIIPVVSDGVRSTAAYTGQVRMQRVADLSRDLSAAARVDIKSVLAYIWLAGVIAMLLYMFVKTIAMFDSLKGAKRMINPDCYQSDRVDTSFVLGVFRPRIYIQAGLSESEEAYILMHERIHTKYRDHITRLIGVITLCVHWFNPIVWVAFAKMCADLEMRCDEAVIDRMGNKIRKEYCRSIVSHALERGNVQKGLYTAFAGDNHGEREVKMRIKNLIRYKKISKIAAVVVSAFAIGLTVVLSAKAQGKNDNKDKEYVTKEMVALNEAEGEAVSAGDETNVVTADATTEASEKVGAPVSVPGNILLDMTEEECLMNYGKEDLPLPADVEYSDEGRPYSKTYDYRDTPALKALADVLTGEGFTQCDPDVEYLDKQGNTKVGRELYVYNCEKMEADREMSLNAYMVSEEYALDSFDEKEEKNGIWWNEIFSGDNDGWYMTRIYDTKTGIMIDATGTYNWDWQSLDLFGRE